MVPKEVLLSLLKGLALRTFENAILDVHNFEWPLLRKEFGFRAPLTDHIEEGFPVFAQSLGHDEVGVGVVGVSGQEESLPLGSEGLEKFSELWLEVNVLGGVFDNVGHVVAELGNRDGSAGLPVNVPPLPTEVGVDLVVDLHVGVGEFALFLELDRLGIQDHVVGLEVAWVSVKVFSPMEFS